MIQNHRLLSGRNLLQLRHDFAPQDETIRPIVVMAETSETGRTVKQLRPANHDDRQMSYFVRFQELPHLWTELVGVGLPVCARGGSRPAEQEQEDCW